jgi:hypothetical protein
MPMSKSFQRSAWLALTIGGGVLLGLGTHRFIPADQPLAMALWVAVPIALALGGSLYWWRSLDEVARDAHKTAWFWGGCFGLLIGTVAFVGLVQADPGLVARLAPKGHEPKDYVALGIVGAALAQLTGYLLAWAGWWLAKR